MSVTRTETETAASQPQPEPGRGLELAQLPPPLLDRYELTGELGRGGMGVVYRGWDRRLERDVAVKLALDPVRALPRFRAEMRLAARLQHPGVVPVYDAGETGAGEAFLVMRRVEGRALSAVLRGGERLNRLLGTFVSICQTIAYAHEIGIAHGDLKPSNIMLGAFGETLVMDWGLARLLDGAAPAQGAGSPGYLAPEGGGTRAADVWALGALLYELARGQRAWPQRQLHSYRAALASGARPDWGADPDEPLMGLCRRALELDPGTRPSAAALAIEVRDVLEGRRRRERAERVVERAADDRRALESLAARAARLRDQAQAAERAGDLETAWSQADEAQRLEREAAGQRATWLHQLHTALHLDDSLPSAHALLADHHAERLLAAEAAGDLSEAAHHEALLRAHHQGGHEALLAGEGLLDLRAAPAGTRRALQPMALRGGRWLAGSARAAGRAPELQPHGRYLLTVAGPGCAALRVPLLLSRGGRCAPDQLQPPRADRLGPEDCPVAGGWFVAGGDEAAPDAHPRQRIWLPGFVVRRFPVRNREFLAFLNDLLARGEEAQALRHQPRTSDSAGAEPLFARNQRGQFVLEPAHQGIEHDAPVALDPEWPVVCVDWEAATAFARWEAARSGRPWRLIHSLEREKAARGVDGRLFPWGDRFHPSWVCHVGAFPDRAPGRQPVDSFPADESPYGVRGLAGHVRDWCCDAFSKEPPPARVTPSCPSEAPLRVVRGGAWSSSAAHCRAAARFASKPAWRLASVGLRLARPLIEEDYEMAVQG